MNVVYLFRRLKGMNYGRALQSAKHVANITGKSTASVMMDIVDCYKKHGTGYVDYETFEMYNMNDAQRAEILSVSKNNMMVRKLNQADKRFYLDDKAVFNKHYDKFIKRDWLLIDGDNFDAFDKFCEDKESIFMKPLDQSCGAGIEKLRMEDYSTREDRHALYQRLLADKCVLAEEVVVQCEEMSKLCTTSVNTVRLVTILKDGVVHVAAGAIRMGKEGAFVDNFNHGGLAVLVDVNKGESVTDGYDKWRKTYEYTPILGTKLKGFKIPQWEACVELVKEAALVVPEVRYIAWDVCITENYGPLLIEGNAYPGQDVTQYPKLNLGTYKEFKKILGDEI